MLNCTPSIQLPDYNSLVQFEGKGNWAIRKYYKLPYSIFYKQKLKMIVRMLGNQKYFNILDFGSGPGIFTKELRRHAQFVRSMDKGDSIDPRWRFDVIVCSSVLEFIPNLDSTLRMLRGMLNQNGMLLIASPMDTKLSRFYFDHIKDTNQRLSHKTIIHTIERHFRIKERHNWLNLYFSLKAVL